MNSPIPRRQPSNGPRRLVGPLATLALLWGLAASAYASEIVPPDAKYHGRTYGEWIARWFEWVLEFPVQDKNGNPVPPPEFDVSEGQSGSVWFITGSFIGDDGLPVERTATIPDNRALFIGLLDADCSSLEAPESGFHGGTEAEQRDCAKFWADHIVPGSLFFEIDGEPVPDIDSYRNVSPQFKFNAPTPWVFGEIGGKGTAVGDGYFVLLEPLSKGEHTISYGGSFLFTVAEDGFDLELPVHMIYHLTVE